jgi:glycosyltransferase involved in cell wall biosynthesis
MDSTEDSESDYDQRRVSVIIPTLNSESGLRNLLANFGSMAPSCEVIVVDGGSSDRTIELSRAAHATVIAGEYRRNEARLKGALAARGEFLMFIDSDQSIDEGLVEECVHVCEKSPADAVVIPERSRGQGIWVQFHSMEKETASTARGTAYPRFFRRDSYFAAGGHTGAVQDFMEDRALSMRLADRGYRLGYAEKRIWNELGDFDLLAFSRKNASAARDAHHYYLERTSDSLMSLFQSRILEALDVAKRVSRRPDKLALLSIYLTVGYAPRLLIATRGAIE